MAKSEKFQNSAELFFVFDPLSWLLVLDSVVSCLLSVVGGMRSEV